MEEPVEEGVDGEESEDEGSGERSDASLAVQGSQRRRPSYPRGPGLRMEPVRQWDGVHLYWSRETHISERVRRGWVCLLNS